MPVRRSQRAKEKEVKEKKKVTVIDTADAKHLSDTLKRASIILENARDARGERDAARRQERQALASFAGLLARERSGRAPMDVEGGLVCSYGS